MSANKTTFKEVISIFKLICPLCSTTQRRRAVDSSYKCIGCGSHQIPLYVTEELVKSAKGLMKLGIKLSAVYTYEINNRGSTTYEIRLLISPPSISLSSSTVTTSGQFLNIFSSIKTFPSYIPCLS